VKAIFLSLAVIPVMIISIAIPHMSAQAQASSAVAQIPGVTSDGCHPGPGPKPWTDSSQTPECRALEVIAQMTKEEKLHFGGYGAGAIERLGLVAAPGADGPNGIAGGGLFPGPIPPRSLNVTAFPNVITLAATWDRDLAKRFGIAVGEEFAGKGMASDLGPTINLLRTWHWGRSAETFGEDPYLTAEMVVPEIIGLQSQRVIAVVKHFAGNNQEYGRTGVSPDFAGVDERISEKALNEIYFPHFKAAVHQAHNGGIMCAYNQVNGQFSCDNPELLGHLRDWGFDGYIVPDAAFAQRSVLAAALAGVDALSPAEELDSLIKQGKLPASFLDAKVFHMLTPSFRLGIYDPHPTGNPSANVSTPEHVELSQEIAEHGTVLLKNSRDVLPFSANTKSIAIIGDDAGPNAQVMETGSAEVHVMKLSVPLEAIEARAGKTVKVTYARGTPGIGPLSPVPSDALTPSSGKGQGLRAEYFRSADWTGEPVMARIDPTIDFSDAPLPEFVRRLPGSPPPSESSPQPGSTGGAQPPTPAVVFRPPSWSARWTGTLTPKLSGVYSFSVNCGGTAQLYVDNKRVVTVMRADFPMTAQGLIDLSAGHAVPIELKYSSASNLLGQAIKLGWQPPDAGLIAGAVDAARQSEVAIVFVSERMGEGHDKMFLNLPGNQDRLIDAVARANPRTVVVLHTSNPVAMPWIDEVSGVIEAWYPGQEAGSSIAAILFGDVNPSGKLPVTFPASDQQGPGTNSLEYPGDGYTVNFDEGVFVGYRWYDAKSQSPLFPFGFGLSYTTFVYDDLELERNGDHRNVKVRLTNTGRMAGAEVVQLYIGDPAAAQEPPRQLKAFQKVFLQPGESRIVAMTLDDDAFSSWDEVTHKWRVIPGAYTISVGSSSRDIRVKTAFTYAAN
jgi:beta-glucosidase